jgi:hypothetical protein
MEPTYGRGLSWPQSIQQAIKDCGGVYPFCERFGLEVTTAQKWQKGGGQRSQEVAERLINALGWTEDELDWVPSGGSFVCHHCRRIYFGTPGQSMLCTLCVKRALGIMSTIRHRRAIERGSAAKWYGRHIEATHKDMDGQRYLIEEVA